MAEVAPGVVGIEGGFAQQVTDGLHQVALGVEPEMLGRRLVAPLDVALGVKQQHPVGRRLQRRQELLQARIAGLCLLLPLAQQPAHALDGFAPQAM